IVSPLFTGAHIPFSRPTEHGKATGGLDRCRSRGELQTNDLTSAGILYARAGDVSGARSVLRRLDVARKAVPSSWNKSSYRNLEAEIALVEGKSDQAVKSLQAAVAEYPRSLSHLDL